MEIIEFIASKKCKYKDVKKSKLSLYYYCVEHGILIGKDQYNKPYAVFCFDNNKVVRNITFNNCDYKWNLCFLTDKGVKFLRKNKLLKSYYM